MTLKEILKEQGLTDDQIKKITDAMKDHKIFTAGEENLDIRYKKLQEDLDALSAKDTESQKLIAELEKATAGQEDVQTKISEYEATIAAQQKELDKVRLDNALKFALMNAGAVDIDYLVFKAGEKGEIALDENGKLKNEDDLIKGLKTQLPNMFQTSGEGNKGRKILENPLPGGGKEQTVTKEQFKSMGYNDRLKFKKENPEQYEKYMKG